MFETELTPKYKRRKWIGKESGQVREQIIEALLPIVALLFQDILISSLGLGNQLVQHDLSLRDDLRVGDHSHVVAIDAAASAHGIVEKEIARIRDA